MSVIFILDWVCHCGICRLACSVPLVAYCITGKQDLSKDK
jgi:hypothetical protein